MLYNLTPFLDFYSLSSRQNSNFIIFFINIKTDFQQLHSLLIFYNFLQLKLYLLPFFHHQSRLHFYLQLLLFNLFYLKILFIVFVIISTDYKYPHSPFLCNMLYKKFSFFLIIINSHYQHHYCLSSTRCYSCRHNFFYSYHTSFITLLTVVL